MNCKQNQRRLAGLLAAAVLAFCCPATPAEARISKLQEPLTHGSYAKNKRGHSHKLHHRGKGHARVSLSQQIGVIVVSESGETVMDELSDLEFNPASVAKLVTAYGAIKTFGLDHQFTTRILLTGKLDPNSGRVDGDVYLEGSDPDFKREDALELKKLLTTAGVKKINGKLYVSPGFSYGSAADPLWSARSLSRIWSKSMPVTKGVGVAQAPEDQVVLCEHQSETLRETLKDMLSYSKNNVAEQIGRTAGGISKLEAIVLHEAGLSPGSLKLASASGLGKNRVKPKVMLQVLKALRSELKGKGLDLQDICPVAGIDHGTLDERFTDPCERGSVVGKTGTLPGTDGGASALAGIFRAQKEDYYFVIFCWRGSVVGFRHQQDELIRKLQSARGGPRPFEYNISKANG